MKAYTTFAGAKRAANGKPIVRIVDGWDAVWIIVGSLQTDISVNTTDGPHSRTYVCAGTTSAFDIAAKDNT